MVRYDPTQAAQSVLDFTPRSGWSYRRYLVSGAKAPQIPGAEVIGVSRMTWVVRVRTHEESAVLSRLLKAGLLIEEDVQRHPCAG
jgi:hypothetical protein